MKKHAPLLLSLVLSLPLGAQTIGLTLVNESGFNELSIGISVPLLGSDSATSNITGNANVTLDIDTTTDTTSEFTINSSSFSATPISLSVGNIIFGNVKIDSNTLGGFISTPTPPAAATPGANGNSSFDAADHQLTVNSGILTVTGDVTGIGPVNTTVDLATSPFSGASSGTGTVTLSQSSSTPSTVTYDVTMTLPVAFSDTIMDPSIPVDITVNVSGTVKATGSVTVSTIPTFAEWTQSESIPGTAFNTVPPGQSLPAGLLWALGYDLGDKASSVLTIENKTLTVTAAPSGSRAPVILQGSANSNVFDWSTFDTIPIASTGPQAISPAAAARAQFRLFASP